MDINCKFCVAFYILCLSYFTLGLPADKNVTSYLDVKKYTLNYVIDLENDIFNGTVDIDITVKDADKLDTLILLESEGLKIEDVSLRDDASSTVQSIPFTSTKYNISLILQKKLQNKSAYTISLNFFGQIDSDDKGIIKTDAHDSKFISTNFYPFYARKAFPCFNDVFMKSVFSLTISTSGQSNLRVFSNMPIEHKDVSNTLYQFKDTPKIPIYSLFFTIGNYIPSSAASYVYVPKNTLSFNNELDYVLENNEYQQFLKKINSSPVKMVCVPGYPLDTFAGYGIVAVREDNLFFDLKKLTTEQRKSSLLNIFGAVFKVFYGNYLTPKTWSDLWLVESIPTYLKYNGLSEVSNWGEPNDYINYDVQDTVLLTNAHPNSRPVVDKTLQTESDVLNFIDSTALLKGAGVLRMLENVLTKDILIEVLMDYFTFRTGKDGIVDTEDFTKFLMKNVKVKNIIKDTNVLNTWLYQGGYPYLQTKRVGPGITVEEGVFAMDLSEETDVQPWTFPIFFSSENDPVFDNDNYFWLLMNDNRTVSLNVTASQFQWIVINVNGTGLYRVNYENDDWVNLAIALSEDYNMFPASTRAKLISDAFAMLYASKTEIQTIFIFFNYLRNEDALTPWLTALQGFTHLRSLLYKTDLKDDFNMYMQNFLPGIYGKLGLDNMNVNNDEGMLRQKIASATCKFGDAKCLRDTMDAFKKLNDSYSHYSPNNDVRPVIICNGIRDVGNVDEWMYFFNSSFDDKQAIGREIRNAYYEALTCSQEDGPIDQFLNLIFSAQKVIAKDDVRAAFRAIYTNPEHASQALEYLATTVLKDNKKDKNIRQDLSMDDKIRLLRDITPYLTENKEMDNLQKYLDLYKPPKTMADAVKETMNTLNKTQIFLTTNHDEFKKAFQMAPTPPTSSTTSSSGSSSSGSSGTDTTGTGTSTTPNPNSTSTTTHKPSSASILNVFSLITLILIYLGHHFIA